jgi:hypothetical protein
MHLINGNSEGKLVTIFQLFYHILVNCTILNFGAFKFGHYVKDVFQKRRHSGSQFQS